MKSKITLLAVFVLSINFQLSTALAQGNLTPPGPPGATMLTLAQVEPRTPIASAPFTITQPGSYYLTTNLGAGFTNAIIIATNGVTLDLNGFTIFASGGPAPLSTTYGILINSGLRNITIANGFIQGGVTNNGSGYYSGSGFVNGIAYSGQYSPVNVLVSRVSVSGCVNHGIYLGFSDSVVVESCTVRTVGSHGIFASTIKQSSAIDCGADAIYGDQVSDCRGQCSWSGDGVGAGTAALNCYGSSSSGFGVSAFTAQNCYGSSGSGYGLYAESALNCYGSSGGSSDGLYADFCALNCSGANNGSGSGVSAATAQNCYGGSRSGDGVEASSIANGCYGYSLSGTGVSAFIASACHGVSGTGTALSTSHNVNSY